MQGDATLYMRSDQVEAAWKLVMPILDHWAAVGPDFPNYAAGSWGPEAADAMLAADSRRWLLPTFASRDPDEHNGEKRTTSARLQPVV
jgi:glucose-6-phosphate 1-dehydrogenase